MMVSTVSPEWIKDVIGNNYIGIRMYNYIVWPFVDALKQVMDNNDDFLLYTKNQKERDDCKYHITLFNVMEVDNMIKKWGAERATEIFNSIMKVKVDDIYLKGIGKATKAGNTAYFVVADSLVLDNLRSSYSLPNKDFHITIGFNRKDVFGVSKSETIKIDSPFIKLFRNLFYNVPNLLLLRNIKNWDKKLTGDILPIEITSTRIRVWCDGTYMEIGEVDDNGHQLRVLGKWEGGKPTKVITQTEILKFIKDNEQR